MKIVLFEDNQCKILYPLGFFNPLHSLQVGSWTLHSIIELLNIPVITIIREHFLFNGDKNPVIGKHDSEPVLFLNVSIEPDVRYFETIKDVINAGDPFITTSGNRVAAALIPPGKDLPENISPQEVSPLLLEMDLPLERKMFKTIDWPHETVESHLRLFGTNLDKVISIGKYHEKQPGFFVSEDVNLASTVAVNTEDGPVVIESGVTVMDFTFLKGPIHIGKNSRITERSSIKDQSSVGKHCKVGGEVEASVIDSYSNKQHHGFLGHSWVGKWVNLGAGTSTSNLKSTYGKVRVDYNGERVGTNMQFLGSVIGDFSKTAINTSLFTGKIVGVCSLLYGTVTTNVPSFSSYARSFGQVTEINPEQVIKIQQRMFLRRGVKQTDCDIELVKRVFEMTRHERTRGMKRINF